MSEGNGSSKKKRAPLVAPRFTYAEQSRNLHRAVLEHGTTLDEIQDPQFWSYVGVTLRPFDKIEVVEEAGAFYAELLVTRCDRNFAMVEVLAHKPLQAIKADEADADIEARWRGPHHKWCAVRRNDGAVLKDGMQSRAEVAVFIQEHERRPS